MSTPSRSASARASALGRTLKPTTSASEAEARFTSFSVMPPTPVWMTPTRTSGVLDLLELAEQRLDRALDVALEDDVQVLDLAGLEIVVQRLERDATSRALGELLAAEPLRANVRKVLRLALVLDDADELARRRRVVEAEHLDRLALAPPRLTFSPR